MNIKEPKVFKYLALGIFFVIPMFVFFGFKANTASADTIRIPTSVMHAENNFGASTCNNPLIWRAMIDLALGPRSDWEGEMTFNLKDISRFATISSVPGDIKVCSYGATIPVPMVTTNYIQQISSSGGTTVCNVPPFPFVAGNNNIPGDFTQTSDNMGIIGQANIDSTANWKCINIDASAVQPVVAQARSGQDKYLYLRWWGQDLNGGMSPFAEYQGPGAAVSNCGGSNPSGVNNCAPYIEINYSITVPLCTAQHTVRGEAWSENIGWIRFSCPIGDYLDYGVEVDFDTGAFSGYAWSENIGWIKFDPQTSTAPDPVGGPVRLNLENNEVKGWARACAGAANADCTGGTNPAAGGWDGWIKLRGPTYGVWRDTTLSPRQLRDWAWSDNVIGWVSFNWKNCDSDGNGITDTGNYPQCPVGQSISDYKVILDSTPPTVTNPTSSFVDPCHDALHPKLSWTYNDGSPSAYQIQISTSSTGWSPPDILDKTVSCAPPCDVGNSYTVNNTDIVTYHGTDLLYGTAYYWRVRAKKSGGDWSDWSATGTFTTFAHELPDPSFTHNPENPPANQEVIFTDNSTCYDSGNNPYPCRNGLGNRYQWDFESDGTIDCDSDIIPSCRGDVTHTYTTEGTRTVKLSITDAVGTCSFAEPVSSFRLPQWKEVSPTGWINKFLASVSSYFNHLISP